MPKYTVTINRIGFSNHAFEVNAKDPDQAKKKALEKACDYSFSEHDAEYEIENINKE